MVTTVNRLHMDATATVAACRDTGIPIRVTVVDRSGMTQVQMRDTTAPPITLNISKKKACTAIMFNAKGSELQEWADSPLATLGEGRAFMPARGHWGQTLRGSLGSDLAFCLNDMRNPMRVTGVRPCLLPQRYAESDGLVALQLSHC